MTGKEIDLFIFSQLAVWNAYRNNYEGLKDIRVRSIDFGSFEIYLQFNPMRVISTTADVSPEKIEKRPCFLCREHRSREQKSIEEYGYDILVNPYPIFRKHLTISKIAHVRQSLKNETDNMLLISAQLEDFTVFYNGPQSGASAPDHMHFQAVPRGDIPFTDTAKAEKEKLTAKSNVEIYGAGDILRKYLIIEGDSRENICVTTEMISGLLTEGDGEQRVNVYSEYNGAQYKVIIVPRAEHRPWQYFSEVNPVFFSPGAVDIGGVVVTVREEDFQKINKELLIDMFSQIIINEQKWKQLTEKIKKM
ncbi:MAG: DUF4922 domain-containing protein [Rikenellaceae bacterium]|nr:DUF4922 domain-containing protein [Rikenellaceae bacterium]